MKNLETGKVRVSASSADVEEIVTKSPEDLDLDELRSIGLRSAESYRVIFDYVQQYGWKNFLAMLETDPDQGVDVLQYTIRAMGDYRWLPDDVLDPLLQEPMSPFLYVILEDVRQTRARLTAVAETVHPNELSYLLTEHDVEFRNHTELNKSALVVFSKMPELRDWAIERQLQWMSQDDLYRPEPYFEMTDDVLVPKLYPAYKLDAIMEYVKAVALNDTENPADWYKNDLAQSLLGKVYPPAEQLSEIFVSALRSNGPLYEEFIATYCTTDRSFSTLSPDVATAALPLLIDEATYRHPESLEMQLMFIRNAEIVNLSSDTYLITGPSGDHLGVMAGVSNVSTNRKEKDGIDTAMPVTIAIHLLTQITSGNQASATGVASALHTNWQYFPEPIRATAESYGLFPHDGAAQLRPSGMGEQIAALAGFDRKLPPSFVQDVADYLHNVVKAGYQAGSQNDVIVDTGFTQYDSLFYKLNPSITTAVENTLGIQLRDLSSPRELFSLLGYLEGVKAAQPLRTIEAMLAGAHTRDERMDRLRAFLVDTEDVDAIENMSVFSALIETDHVNRMFAAYSGSIVAADQLQQNFKTITRDPFTLELLQELEACLLKRAGHLFRAGKQMAFREYAGEEKTLELIEAYRGIALVQDVIARIGSSEEMSVSLNQQRSNVEGRGDAVGTETFYFDINDAKTGYELGLKVSIRPMQTSSGEARINFELYLDRLLEGDPLRRAFEQEVVFTGKSLDGKKASRKKNTKGSIVRFGFDLDTRSDPPKLSFDMGRNKYVSDKMSRSGDVLGNILEHVSPEGHHLTSFDNKFSDPRAFAAIAETFSTYFRRVAERAVLDVAA